MRTSGSIALALSALVTAALTAAPALAAQRSSIPRPPVLPSGARPSAALMRMMRDRLARGLIVPQKFIDRWGLDLEEAGDVTEAAYGRIGRTVARADRVATLALGADRLVNDRSGDTVCPECGNRPWAQAETSVATWGDLVLVGWNDSGGFCPPFPAVQGYGYSTDGGATWVDGGEVPTPVAGARWRGDPVHTVNRTTGDFYIVGLFEDPTNVDDSPQSGLALARGHFSGGTFVIDHNAVILTAGGTPADPNFLDKEWVAVDPGSGNVYVAYTNFKNVGTTGGLPQIELIRSTTAGVGWSAPIQINAPATNGSVQGVRVAVGPAGEVYVVWYEYDGPNYPRSHLRVRRSDDLGVSFGPERTVADFFENGESGAPGFRRGFGIPFPSAAVDMSAGSHRGRVYVTWDETVNTFDAPGPFLGAVPEVETNDTFAGATPFSLGQAPSGTLSDAGDLDIYRFTGTRGQTIHFFTYSNSTGAILRLRLVSDANLTSFENLRFLAHSSWAYPAFGFTLPYTGTYYLYMTYVSGPEPVDYAIATYTDTPTAGDRARDQRDRFVSWSDDGTTWSTPVRLNDDDPWYDGVFPEIAVDDRGIAHCYWHDFRDDAFGAESYEYMTSSGDGGVTWGPNQRLSDEKSFWSAFACGTANQGDYQGITAGGQAVYPCWADSRLGDPDVFMEKSVFSTTRVCPPGQSVAGGSLPMLTFRVTNTGTGAGQFGWNVEDDNGWVQGATPGVTGSVSLAPGSFQDVLVQLAITGSCSPATDQVRFVTSDAHIPGWKETCATTLTCTAPTTAVAGSGAAALTLFPPRPNPTRGPVRLGFTLAEGGTAEVGIFGAGGRRIRALARGPHDAGPHDIVWDGRDEYGRLVPAGLYYVRLRTQGQSLQKPVSVAR